MRKSRNFFLLALQLNAVASKSLSSLATRSNMLAPPPCANLRPANRLKVISRSMSRMFGQALRRGRSQSNMVAFAYTTCVEGEPGTPSYRLRFSDESGKSISPWHDIPLSAGNGIFNALFEIPKMTKPKMEVATKEPGNPIAQDEKKGKLRDYHGPIFWNYGMFPQTWEDPSVEEPSTKCTGDNDPLDVVEIGSKVLPQGTVIPVKPLGALAMIDEGELDWKVIAVSMDDPLAAKYNDISDVPEYVISGIREWFRWYKTPDGKPLNSFGLEEKPLNREQTLKVIAETHEAWKRLTSGETETGKLWVSSPQAAPVAVGAASAEMVIQTSTDVVTVVPLAMISVFVGSAVIFVVLRVHRGTPIAGDERLLVA